MFIDNLTKVLIIVGLIVAAGVVIALKQNNKDELVPQPQNPAVISGPNETQGIADVTNASQSESETRAEAEKALPILLDLGARKCIPCKMMAPILEELSTEYTGLFKVEFIDVWENPQAAEMHGVRVIPVQIFFDANGKELFRHEGFFPKADILAKWKELGVDLRNKQR